MRRFILSLFFSIALLFACQDNSVEPDTTESFSGQLVVTKWQESYQWTFVDTDLVLFTVSSGQYDLVHIKNNTTLCNSSGIVNGFGSSKMILTPSSKVGSGGCDTLRVPQGEFPTVFRGDSLYIGPTEVTINTIVNGRPSYDIMTYSFALSK